MWCSTRNNLRSIVISNLYQDLPNCLSQCVPRMYADGTHLTFSASDNEDICVNADMSNINQWLSVNKLTLNKSKTDFMLICSEQKLNNMANSVNLEIDGLKINQVSSCKSLGVTIDDTLSWNEHINTLSKMVASGIGAVKRIGYCVPPTTLRLIYNSLVQSYSDYCNIVWGNCGLTLAKKL